MRDLTASEIEFVSGGTGVCTPASSGRADSPNSYLGGSAPSTIGRDLIAVYEGLVAATSHVIERVAKSFD